MPRNNSPQIGRPPIHGRYCERRWPLREVIGPSIRKLTARDVRGIRARDRWGWTQTEIAEHYGVTSPTIWHVLQGLTWGDVS